MARESVLDRAVAHFKRQLEDDMEFVEVPEWTDEEGCASKIYFRTVMNLREQRSLSKLVADGQGIEAVCEQLIVMAREADGSKMFTPADKPRLMRLVDEKVVARVVSEIMDVYNEHNSLPEDVTEYDVAEKP